MLRNAYQGTECWIIDPEDEYARLAAGTGGTYIHLGADGVRLNPFDLPAPAPGARPRADALTRRALFVAHRHRRAARRTAEPGRAGRAGPGDHGRLPPGRDHLRPPHLDPARPPAARTWPPRCARDATDAAVLLADRLVPFTEGTHSGMFDGPTTTRPEGHLVVFSLRDVPDELRAVATLLALDAVWRQVSDPAARRRRLVVSMRRGC